MSEELIKELRKREPASLKVFVAGQDPVGVEIGDGRYRWRNAAELCESYSYDRIEGHNADGLAVMNYTPAEPDEPVVDLAEVEAAERLKVAGVLSPETAAVLEGQRMFGDNLMASFKPLFDAQNQLVSQLTQTVAGLVQSHIESLNLLRDAAFALGKTEAKEEQDANGPKQDGVLGGIGSVLEGVGKLQTENPKLWDLIVDSIQGQAAGAEASGGNGVNTEGGGDGSA